MKNYFNINDKVVFIGKEIITDSNYSKILKFGKNYIINETSEHITSTTSQIFLNLTGSPKNYYYSSENFIKLSEYRKLKIKSLYEYI